MGELFEHCHGRLMGVMRQGCDNEIDDVIEVFVGCFTVLFIELVQFLIGFCCDNREEGPHAGFPFYLLRFPVSCTMLCPPIG